MAPFRPWRAISPWPDSGRSIRTHGGVRFWRVLFALAVIVLLLLGVTAAVSHGHAPGAPDHDGCSLCMAAHAIVGVVLVYAFAMQRRATCFCAHTVQILPRRAMECPCWNRPPPTALFS
jgi:hypothetical protein